MPRTKSFNRTDALDKAMQAFWAHGYEATSIQDLVDCMGINRGSLYDTFGDKRQLFLEALDQYTHASLARGTILTKRDRPAKEILSEFLYAFMNRNLQDAENRGCFVTNTAIERAAKDNDCASKIRFYFASIEEDMTDLIAFGQEEGEIRSRKDPASLAAFFIGIMQGIRVVAKVNQNEESLRPLVDVALASLDE